MTTLLSLGSLWVFIPSFYIKTLSKSLFFFCCLSLLSRSMPCLLLVSAACWSPTPTLSFSPSWAFLSFPKSLPPLETRWIVGENTLLTTVLVHRLPFWPAWPWKLFWNHSTVWNRNRTCQNGSTGPADNARKRNGTTRPKRMQHLQLLLVAPCIYYYNYNYYYVWLCGLLLQRG